MFKVCVQASSFEELKQQLEPMFKMMDKFSKPSQPSAEDLGYSEDEEPSAPLIVETAAPTGPVVTPSLPPFAAPPVVVAPVAASPVHTVDDDGDASEGSVPANSNGPDRDSRGIPWDNRIHSSNRGMKKDGTWKYRRNVDEVMIKQIEAGLTAPVVSVPIPEVPNMAPASIAPFTPIVVPANVTPSLPPALPPTTAPVEPVAPVTPPPPPVAEAKRPPAHSLITFRSNFITILNDLINENKVDQKWIASVTAHYKLGGIWELTKYDQYLTEVFESFVGWGFIQDVR